ncbi:MAG: holo-ACP synthase [Thermotaleaceae bacterium]
MIKGIGIDIIEVERIKKAATKNKNFLEKIFTNKEIEYFQSNYFQATTIAGNFAAKEAVAKTLGTGFRGFRWIDIEVRHDALGKPEIVLYGQAEKVSQQMGIQQIWITISHSKDYAVAQAIAL